MNFKKSAEKMVWHDHTCSARLGLGKPCDCPVKTYEVIEHLYQLHIQGVREATKECKICGHSEEKCVKSYRN